MFGLIAGALAKLVMPGKDPGGIIVTTLIGIGGALLGGFIAAALDIGDGITAFDLGSFLVAVGGSLLLLAGYRLVVGDR